jgi:uncharacterized membrane protein
VHELVGQFAGIREQQQALGVDVQAPDGLPFALCQARQAPEHRRTVLRIVVRHDLADGLVVRDDARRRRRDAHLHRAAVDLDVIAKGDALTDVRRLTVDGDLALEDQLLHVATRADAGLRQHLVQLGCVGLGAQHALVRGRRPLGRGLFLGGVERPRDDLGEHLAGIGGRQRLDDLGLGRFVVILPFSADGERCLARNGLGVFSTCAPAIAAVAATPFRTATLRGFTDFTAFTALTAFDRLDGTRLASERVAAEFGGGLGDRGGMRWQRLVHGGCDWLRTVAAT